MNENKLSHKALAAILAVPVLLTFGVVGLAGATPPDAGDTAGTLVDSGVTGLTDVITTIGPKVVGLLILVLAVRMAVGAVRSRGSRVV